MYPSLCVAYSSGKYVQSLFWHMCLDHYLELLIMCLEIDLGIRLNKIFI